jgi:hypothetical protein
VCGEGGEYETLVLDCPLFTRARIALQAWQPVSLSAGGPGAVAVLHPTAFSLEGKPTPGRAAAAPGEQLRCTGAGADAGAAGDGCPLVALMPEDCMVDISGASDARRDAEGQPSLEHAAEAAVRVSSSGVHAACAPRLAEDIGSREEGSRVGDALHAALFTIQQGGPSASICLLRCKDLLSTAVLLLGTLRENSSAEYFLFGAAVQP